MATSYIQIDNPNVTLELVDTNDRVITVNYGERKPFSNGKVDITIKAKEGFKIESAGVTDGNDRYVKFTVNSDGSLATATGVNLYFYNDFTVDIITSEVESPSTIVRIDNENVVMEMVHSDGTIYTVNYGEDVEIKLGVYNITLNVNEGFKIEYAFVQDYNDRVIEFTILDDGLTATASNVNLTGVLSGGYTISITTREYTHSFVSGFNNLYLVDRNILKLVSKERFTSTNGVDLGQYIINVLELPFPILDELKGNETQIRLGNTLLQTKAVEILNDEMVLNLGSITIPSKYNNSYDFLNTNVYLHLPFSKTIELDVNYTISQTITITYIIDLYSGDTSINITSTKIDGEMINNEIIKIGKNIPFIQKSGEIIGNSLITSNGVNNQVFTPFIEVIRNKPYEMDNFFNEDTSIQTKLKNETGYVRINNIDLKTSATLEEKNRIITQLRNGVVIK